MTPAQRAAAAKPSEQTLARVMAAYLPQDAALLHDFAVRTGWRIRVYRSPWTENALLACAERDAGTAPATLDSECADLAAVKAWVKGLPV